LPEGLDDASLERLYPSRNSPTDFAEEARTGIGPVAGNSQLGFQGFQKTGNVISAVTDDHAELIGAGLKPRPYYPL